MRSIILTMLIGVVGFWGCENNPTDTELEDVLDTLTVKISNAVYGGFYPAVWFCPSTGEIAPVGDSSDPDIEIPPETKYRFWVEPRDPEFCAHNDGSELLTSALLIGNGKSYFTENITTSDERLSSCVRGLENNNVYYLTSPEGNCLILILDFQWTDNYLRFLWKSI